MIMWCRSSLSTKVGHRPAVLQGKFFWSPKVDDRPTMQWCLASLSTKVGHRPAVLQGRSFWSTKAGHKPTILHSRSSWQAARLWVGVGGGGGSEGDILLGTGVFFPISLSCSVLRQISVRKIQFWWYHPLFWRFIPHTKLNRQKTNKTENWPHRKLTRLQTD